MYPKRIDISKNIKKIFEANGRASHANKLQIIRMDRKPVHNFTKRYNRKECKPTAGTALNRQSLPPKDYVVRKPDKTSKLKYILARKDRKIQDIEIGNELIRLL